MRADPKERGDGGDMSPVAGTEERDPLQAASWFIEGRTCLSLRFAIRLSTLMSTPRLLHLLLVLLLLLP